MPVKKPISRVLDGPRGRSTGRHQLNRDMWLLEEIGRIKELELGAALTFVLQVMAGLEDAKRNGMIIWDYGIMTN